MSGKMITKAELLKKYNEVTEELRKLKSEFQTLGGTLQTTEYRLREAAHHRDEANRNLKITLAENVHLKQELDTAQDKVEKLYAQLITQNDALHERKALADHWYRKQNELLNQVLERGRVRMKYDMPYAIWRDNTMERLATGRTNEPVDMNELAKRLGQLCGGQLPNGSNDFFAAMLRIAEEFGYVVNGRHMAIPKAQKEAELKKERSFAMPENFKNVYSDAAQEVIHDLHEKAVVEMMDLEDKRCLEGIKDLIQGLDPRMLPQEVSFTPGTFRSKRLKDLKQVRFVNCRNLASMVYKKKDGTPLMLYAETLPPTNRERVLRRIVDFEVAMGWVTED